MEPAIIAIALLCSNPIQNRLTTTDVLDCQKYYVNCTSTVVGKDQYKHAIHKTLDKYILEKQELGGSK